MKTKRQILKKHLSEFGFMDVDGGCNLEDIENAMDEYAEQQVKLFNTPAVSVNEVAVCPRCKSKEVSVKPVTYDCYECGATWQTER